MSHNPTPPDKEALRKWLHDANNCLGVILASAELLQMDNLPPRSAERCQTIESKAMEVREILRSLSDSYFSGGTND